MVKYYWMHREYGYLLTEDELFDDALAMNYDDITDECSVEYLNFDLYYVQTTLRVY